MIYSSRHSCLASLWIEMPISAQKEGAWGRNPLSGHVFHPSAHSIDKYIMHVEYVTFVGTGAKYVGVE